MPELASEAWEEIERQYGDGAPIDVLAHHFNVSRARIKRRANKLGWVRSGRDDHGAASAGQGEEQAPASSKDTPAGDGTLADQHTSLIEQQRAAWAGVYQLRDDAHRILKGEQPQLLTDVRVEDVQERLSVALKVMAIFEKEVRALTAAQEGERRAYGLSAKRHEASPTNEEAVRHRCELITAKLNIMRSARLD